MKSDSRYLQGISDSVQHHRPKHVDRKAATSSRFWNKVEKTETCWFWRGAIGTHGYGTFWLEGAYVRAHRVAYELVVGAIPAGMFLDHLCRTKACVNPAHLEPVTARENTLRGVLGRLKTHCANGHAYTSENTYVQKSGARAGRRWCRLCKRAQQARRAT